MKDKYVVNDAFQRIYNSLIEKKLVKSKGELANLLGVKPSTLSEILAKRQGVTVEFIQRFCESFPIVTPNDFFDIKGDQDGKNEEIINLQRQVLKLQNDLIDLQNRQLNK